MNQMTNVQKEYINSVILPTLVNMAIEGTLDSDMNILSHADFEAATEKFNAMPDTAVRHQRQIDILSVFVAEDDVEDALERLLNETSHSATMDDVVTMAHHAKSLGCMPIDSFWNDYMPN